MFRLLVVLGLAASALSQCPTSSEESTEDGYYCQPVSTINRTLQDLARDQPILYTFMPNIAEFNQLDNFCVTMFPVYNETEQFIIYSAYVYNDSSVMIKSYIGKTNGTGVNVWAEPDRTFTTYILGYLDCGMYVKYRCADCGYTDSMPYVFGMRPSFGSPDSLEPVTTACLQQAYTMANIQGLSTDDVYVLPYNLPTQCVYQQLCQPQDTPASCQQQGSCQPS